jgi:hypothetical protein
MRVREALHGTAKVVATVVIAAAVGLGAGRGIAEVAGGSASAGFPADPATDTAAQPQPPADDDAARDAEPAVGVMVTFAGLRPAGRARDRARLRVGLRVRNRSDRSVTIDPPRIQVGEDTIRVDLDAAEDLAGNVLEPLSPGSSAKGELRFETAGETTLELMEGRSTTLRIAGRKIEVRYEVGPPLSQPSEEPSSGSTTTTVPSPQSG